MTTVSPHSEPVGPSEIAKDWGSRGHPVSRQYASKCVHQLGCPAVLTEEWSKRGCATALDAAWLWRTERTDISKLAGGGGGSPGALLPDPAGSGYVSDADSVDVELQRVRELVDQHYRQWRHAAGLKGKAYDASAASAARKAYMDAVNTRVEIEGLVDDYRKSSGQLVDLSLAQRMIDERLAPFRSAIHGFDRALAVELHPEDPAKWRPVIRAVLRRVLLPAITNAKRRLRSTPPHGRTSPAIAA